MTIRTILFTSSLIAASLTPAAHAALLGRDLNGSIDSFEAYYDTDLNITWLADANVNGVMTWPDANTWAANLSFHDAVNNITYDNWRLPTVKPVNGGVNFNYNNFTGTLDGSTDSGFNISEQGTIYAGSTGSEMAHLFYNTLDNKGYYAIICTNCSDPQPQAGWGLANTFPFTNLQAEVYWSGTDWDPYTANSWIFSFNSGYQGAIWKGDHAYASAVSPGDIGIAAVPEPGTYAMFLAGLGLLGVTAWRRNCTQK